MNLGQQDGKSVLNKSCPLQIENTHHGNSISIQASLSELVLSIKAKFRSRLSIDDQLKKELERATEYP